MSHKEIEKIIKESQPQALTCAQEKKDEKSQNCLI